MRETKATKHVLFFFYIIRFKLSIKYTIHDISVMLVLLIGFKAIMENILRICTIRTFFLNFCLPYILPTISNSFATFRRNSWFLLILHCVFYRKRYDPQIWYLPGSCSRYDLVSPNGAVGFPQPNYWFLLKKIKKI